MSGCPAGRGHVRQENLAIGKAGHQRPDERFSRACFPDRYSMYPNALSGWMDSGKKTEAFRNMFTVSGFKAASPEKAEQRKGQYKPPDDGIQNSHEINLQLDWQYYP